MYEKLFSNEVMKLQTEHLEKSYPDKADKNLTFVSTFFSVKFQNWPALSSMFHTDGLHTSSWFTGINNFVVD